MRALLPAAAMRRESRTVSIRAPPDKVFAYLDDPANAPEWAEGIVAIREIETTPGVVGSTFEVDIKEGGRVNTYQGVSLAYDPPRRMRDRMTRAGSTMEMQLDLEPAPEGTKLTQAVEYELPGLMALMAPLVRFMLRKSLQKQTEKIKEVMERS
jgi:uncharacterized protein YndB with AHSA1/START domain